MKPMLKQLANTSLLMLSMLSLCSCSIQNQLLRQAGNALASETQAQEEDLEKASKGEGSKGGKVIGHTKKGKAIYDHQKHSDTKQSIKQILSSDDHDQIKQNKIQDIVGEEKAARSIVAEHR